MLNKWLPFVQGAGLLNKGLLRKVKEKD
ncbi:hypothetical protein BSG1_12731 [Bacillus sp. SG-1]|nr:hypothetical protein BSG1_12731 [Bacillus sp. SG-1]